MPVKPYKPVDWSKPSMALQPKKVPGPKPRPRVPAVPPPPSVDPPKALYSKDQLRDDMKSIMQRMTAFIKDEGRLEQLMAEAKFKELMVGLAIGTDKMLLLEGQPTQIVSNEQHAKIDQLMPAIAQALQQRNLQVALSERKVMIQSQPDPGSGPR